MPDVFDAVKYDCLHNAHIRLDDLPELFYLTRDFADLVVPQEFGIYQKDKRILGSTVCGALLGKIRTDLTKQNDSTYRLDQRYCIFVHDVAVPPSAVSKCVLFV